MKALICAAGIVLASSGPSAAAEATFSVRSLAPETALLAAESAIKTCRSNGHQVAAAVVDRAGILQVFIRDRFAGPHTVSVAVDKAWTAASFKISTSTLALESEPGRPASPVRNFHRVVVMGGGIPIQAGGTLLGAIAVSGAAGGEADEACAQAGVDAIRDKIEF